MFVLLTSSGRASSESSLSSALCLEFFDRESSESLERDMQGESLALVFLGISSVTLVGEEGQ